VPSVCGAFLALLSASGTCARRAQAAHQVRCGGSAARRQYRAGPAPV